MKKYLLCAIALASVSTAVNAEHWDVIAFKLNEGCSFEKYIEIKEDFNKWGEAYGYKATILMPLQNEDLTSLRWIGKSKDAATFGAAWDAWRNGLADPESKPAKLNARFVACSTNTTRTGYDTY